MLAVVFSSGHRLLPLPVLPGTFTTPPPPPLLSHRRPLLAPRRRRCLCGGGGGGLLLLRAVAARRAGIVIDVDEVGEVGDRDLPVDVSFTRRLPPVLTLGDGLAALRRAGEEVKACPPAAAASGVIRFEVSRPARLCGRGYVVFYRFAVGFVVTCEQPLQYLLRGGEATCSPPSLTNFNPALWNYWIIRSAPWRNRRKSSSRLAHCLCFAMHLDLFIPYGLSNKWNNDD